VHDRIRSQRSKFKLAIQTCVTVCCIAPARHGLLDRLVTMSARARAGASAARAFSHGMPGPRSSPTPHGSTPRAGNRTSGTSGSARPGAPPPGSPSARTQARRIQRAGMRSLTSRVSPARRPLLSSRTAPAMLDMFLDCFDDVDDT
jgi:hypothetical protein